MQKAYQNYAFDLYGTLADVWTDEELPEAWAAFARYLSLRGMPLAGDSLAARYACLCREEQERIDRIEAKKGRVGPFEIDLLRVWKALGREHGLTLTQKQAEEISVVFRSITLRRLRPFPDAAALLRALRAAGKRVVLLSNAQASFTLPELRVLGLADAFDAVFLSSDAGVKKPSPDFFGLLAQAGLAPQDTVMIGNDPVCDCWGAARAGMDSLYIQTEQSPPGQALLPPNCRRIGALAELMPR